ncbi:MAG: nucleoside-diphosphate-sugar epimerase [Bdellovibrionales bacterium GWB1_52_6]|nr:MAG: nucleoside-diphosphate-sugar epimerase [Bdellovibrionales bacterium GWB1_52_6]OFZ02965.1 MAG: nucleoside-diphosphate-sugar epimerase [Bdellovibrionales bacterium GWA1_52_35]HCM38511.1 nucleoside-diphosphate-sugar epimerase [Bdellovibrionales bacterium]
MIRRVLITGGAGFIGSHLARELVRSGYTVRVLDNFSAQVHGKSSRIPDQFENIEVIEGDVRTRAHLKHALRDVDAVYHLAASVGVGQSMYEVHSYVENNTLGTANLLQLLIENPVERLVVASSMSLYGEGLYKSADGRVHFETRRPLERLKKKEWEPLGAEGESLSALPTPESKRPDLASIYALSKYDQEMMCLLMGRTYRIPTVALRFFNVYGTGQSLSNPYTGVMAIFASRLLNGKTPSIFEDGKQMRDFVHVSDVVQACRLALEGPQAVDHAFNIGSGEQITIQEVALRMAEAMGKPHLVPEITGQYRVGDIRHCFADISLARTLLGYRPRVSMESGMRELIEWLAGQRAVDRTQEAREELAVKGLAV